MSEIQHCNLCAWRADCQIKYKLIGRSPSARFCEIFSRDVTLGNVPPDEIMHLWDETQDESSRKKATGIFTEQDYRKPRKRYMNLEDEPQDDDPQSSASGENGS